MVTAPIKDSKHRSDAGALYRKTFRTHAYLDRPRKRERKLLLNIGMAHHRNRVSAGMACSKRSAVYNYSIQHRVAMSSRILCPHCRSPIDPLTLDLVTAGAAHCLICCECDGIIPLTGSVSPVLEHSTPTPAVTEVPASMPDQNPCPLTL